MKNKIIVTCFDTKQIVFALPLCCAKNSWHFTSNLRFWNVCRFILSIACALFRNKIGIAYLNSFVNLSRNVKSKWKLTYDVTVNLFHIRKGGSSIGIVLYCEIITRYFSEKSHTLADFFSFPVWLIQCIRLWYPNKFHVLLTYRSRAVFICTQ